MGDIQKLTVSVGNADIADAMSGEHTTTRTLTFNGRVAWALDNLIREGARGCTPITHVGPRWSDYVFKLRKAGVVVETIDEKHEGAYAGSHARYVLRSPVTVLGLVRS